MLLVQQVSGRGSGEVTERPGSRVTALLRIGASGKILSGCIDSLVKMATILELSKMMNLITLDYQRRGGYPKQYGRHIDYPHWYVAKYYGIYSGLLSEEDYVDRVAFVRRKLTEIEVQHNRLGLSPKQFSVVRQFTLALLGLSYRFQHQQLRESRRPERLTYEDIVKIYSNRGKHRSLLQEHLDDVMKGKR